MTEDTDRTPIQTPGEARLLSGDPIEIDIEADRERATLTVCADGVAITGSLFPDEIEAVQADLAAAAARIDAEKVRQAQNTATDHE